MFIKTLLVAMLVIMSWNSIELFNHNAQLREHTKNFSNMQNTVNEQTALNNKLIQKQIKLLEKNNALQEKLVLQTKQNKIQTKQPKKKIKTEPKKSLVVKPLKKKFELVKQAQKNNQIEKAKKQLTNFKNDIWNLRKIDSLNKENVLPVLASIDIVLKKWNSDEKDYSLKNVENKFNKLVRSGNLK